jgi:predicted GNAT family N-acyltransferase
MHAQKKAINFYIKNGYKIKSEEFVEANIPHFIVSKTIKY